MPRNATGRPRTMHWGWWLAGGVGVAGAGTVGYLLSRPHVAPTAVRPSPSISSGSGTSHQGVAYTVSGVQPSALASEVGMPIRLTGTVSPTLTGTGVTLVFADGAGTTLATSATPVQLIWVEPESAAAAAVFGGNIAAIRSWLAAYPYQSGVDTPTNALSYQLTNSLDGTEWGYSVAGLRHTNNGTTVTNTVVPFPSGVTPTFKTLGADPVAAGYVLIGKYAGSQLWQVYPSKPPSASGGGSSSSGTVTAAEHKLASLESEHTTLSQQAASLDHDVQQLESTVSQLQSELAALSH